MVVYLDIVFLINLTMNIVILYFVGEILSLKPVFRKIFAGALAGGILLVEIIYPQLMFFKSLMFKLLISAAMVIISFNPGKPRGFFKILGFFYLISFMVGGSVLAVFYLLNMDRSFVKGILALNNISLPWWILPVSSSVMLLFFRFIWPLLYNILSGDKLLASVRVSFSGRHTSFPALIDTGNDLSDPITDEPVIIVEFEAIKSLFDVGLLNLIEGVVEGDFGDIGKLSLDDNEFVKFRLIPYESIGKSHGLMVGFKPDFVEVIYEKRFIETKDVIIGIHKRHLSSDSTYSALLSPGLLKG